MRCDRELTDKRHAQEQMCLLLREAMNVGRVAINHYFFSCELELREAKMRIKDELLNVRNASLLLSSSDARALFGSIAW